MQSNYLLIQTYTTIKQTLIESHITPAEGYFILQTLLKDMQEALDLAIQAELKAQSTEKQEEISIIKEESSGQEQEI